MTQVTEKTTTTNVGTQQTRPICSGPITGINPITFTTQSSQVNAIDQNSIVILNSLLAKLIGTQQVVGTQVAGTQVAGTQTVINTACQWELFEDEKSYYVCIEMPGVNKENIQVTIAQGTVIVQGTKTCQTIGATNATCLVAQSNVGPFRYQISLTPVAENLDTKQATAVCQNGVLIVTVSKSKQASQSVTTVNVL